MGIDGNKALWNAESGETELWDVTIGELLDRQAAAAPAREALVYSYPEIGISLRLDYRRYRNEVDRVARALIALGIEKGEHVAVWATNLPEWIFLEFALARIGAVMIPVNTNFRAMELEYVLAQGDVTTLFLIEEQRGNSFLDAIYQVAPELSRVSDPIRERVETPRLPRLERVVLIGPGSRPGLLPYARLLELAETVTEEALRGRALCVAPHDPAQIQYTSGTTGFPKGAMLTHYGLVNNARLVAARAGLQPDERYITAMPLFHTGGCVLGVLVALAAGCTLIPLIAFDPAKELELIASEHATFAVAVPTMFIAMLNHPRFQAGEFDTSSLGQVASGGAPVPVVLMEQVKERMGPETWVLYGLTEASPIITQAIRTDSFDLRAATVGRPLPHTEVAVVDPATGQPVAVGETGELRARGYLIMQGYYRMSDKTAEAIDAEGWLHTGDLATMDARGYVKIVGRLKEMIIRGGENLYPAEIEAFLMRHPKVAEAQVVGVPDAVMGEEMAALLRLAPGAACDEAEVREYCRAGISKHKIPKYIRFVTEFPLTASGKVKKFELRKQLIQELGLDTNATSA